MSKGFLSAGAAALAAAVLAGLAWAPSGGIAAVMRCSAFGSQAAAQDHLIAAGGGPGRRVGGLDRDRGGVACEGLGAPFKGYASIGFHRGKRFFYGTVAMPPDPATGRQACLLGNPHFPDGPRVLTVFRARRGPDRAVTGEIGAEVRGTRLVWKAAKGAIPRARYYAVFAERQPLRPYGPNQCPGFSSAPRLLP